MRAIGCGTVLNRDNDVVTIRQNALEEGYQRQDFKDGKVHGKVQNRATNVQEDKQEKVQIERVSFNIFRGNIGILLGCST